MSDRQTFGKRKYLLLVLPILLLLGWFAFAPGNDQKNADSTNTKTSQKQEDRKDKDEEQKPSDTEGEVASASTTTQSTPASTWKPSPHVKVASVVTGTPAPTPQQPQQPTPPNPQTPPADEDPVLPEGCVLYKGEIVQLPPNTASGCYVVFASGKTPKCWLAEMYAFNDGDEPINLSDKLPNGKPYIIFENPYFDENDEFAIDCPVYDTYVRFHVYAPEDAHGTNQPVVTYDYFLPVIGFDLEDDLMTQLPDHYFEVLVDIQDEELPEEPTCELDCEALPV